MMKINDIEFNIKLTYKPKNKRIYFKYSDNTLELVLNRKKLIENYEKFIYMYQNDIYKYIKKCQKQKNVNQTNNSIHLFGKEYNVLINISNKEFIEIKDDTCVVNTLYNDFKHIKTLIYVYYFKELKKYIDSIIDETYNAFLDVKTIFPYKKPILDYKLVKTYFGECYLKENKIILNIILAKYDKLYIKNVLYHEFCHFAYRGHGRDFYQLFESKFINAKKIQFEMKKIKYNDLY